MASKIFNKFKEPKFAEFSRKDLVVDIKNGDLYYKSNLGVHKVPSEISTDTFGTTPATASLSGNTFKNTGTRDGDASITGSLTLIGNVTASGGISSSGKLFANLLNSNQTNIVFYNSSTGELTHDTTGSLLNGLISLSISGAFTSLSASLSATIAGTDTFKTTGHRNGNSVITGSLLLSGSTSHLTASNILVNNITATGTITAQEFHTEFVSSSIIFQSGSAKFGDSQDDIISITGSLDITGSISSSGTITASGLFVDGPKVQVEKDSLNKLVLG